MLVLWLLSVGLICLADRVVDPEMRYLRLPENQSCIYNCDGVIKCKGHIPKCDSIIKHYNLATDDNDANKEFRELLLFGHNGLRNRLAAKLNLCDMLEIKWNNKLALYASRHHSFCHKSIMCDSELDSNVNLQQSRPRDKRQISHMVNMSRNSFFYSNTYSTAFIPFALSNWYAAHVKLKFPKRIDVNNRTYYALAGQSNSFYNMVNPIIQTMGCSIAKFRDGRSLICYYYPFVSVNSEIYFRIMDKSYQCPYTYPIFDRIFKRICIKR
ncbi:uncharacterized protein LOC6579524 [Drosophila mojavensis]|uniref:SCP domain-containing protein n=1 Tax=Drosophila mojavensis TaxID=7230 RepID=B4KRD7_DROMO|nr:uncharacterized protein LOC6579524 [Drosophila mojavensis]EDW09353.2 uncharacterized protein Dmoj_GI19082 [Drosophila mojavensis]